jgi:hypothetical protein
MAKVLQRKKPGYTKFGDVKIVSLSIKQLQEMLEKSSKKKEAAKISRRIADLKRRKGFVEEVVVQEVSAEAVVESAE